ncbi:ECF-type sigma factor [Ahniella affigens]|nr:ECF-type sigma factor [Ahniella affigens]
MSAPMDFQSLQQAWRSGALQARDALVELVYQETKEIARRQLAQQMHATLAPTELAHEALLRVLKQTGDWQDKRHLLNVLALATRQVLVDAARRRMAQKRDGGHMTALTERAQLVAAPGDELLEIDTALMALAEVDARAAEVISLMYFSGQERDAIARLLDCSPSTVDRALRFGRAWLKDALQGQPQA